MTWSLPLCPAEAAAAARRVRSLPGVRGVYWGRKRKRGEWTQEDALIVHVTRKLAEPDRGQDVRTLVPDLATDVMEVGYVVAHVALDTRDPVRSLTGPAPRRSTITAFTRSGTTILALLSGHGTLRIRGGRLESGRFDPLDAPWAEVIDESGTTRGVRLHQGAVSAVVDYAIGSVADVTGDEVFEGHLLAAAPIPLRTTPLQVGERVYHYSAMTKQRLIGRVEQGPVQDPDISGLQPAVLPGYGELFFRNLLIVHAAAGEHVFSEPGDSGSLVFDEARRAIGTVVAGSVAAGISYVLAFSPELEQALGSTFSTFFGV